MCKSREREREREREKEREREREKYALEICPIIFNNIQPAFNIVSKMKGSQDDC